MRVSGGSFKFLMSSFFGSGAGGGVGFGVGAGGGGHSLMNSGMGEAGLPKN